MNRSHFLPPVTRTLSRCLVCGSSEVRTDQVIDHGVVLLSECARCEHRTTERPVLVAAPIRRAEEVFAA